MNSEERLSDRSHKMDRADSIAHYVFMLITFFAIIASVIIIVITTANVISRYCFNRNFNGTVEISEQLMGFIAFGALPIVSMYNGHIKVDLIVEKFSEKGQMVMTVINNLLCTAVMAYLGYHTFDKGIRIMEKHMHTTSLKIPLWPLYMFICVMFFVSALCCIYSVIHILVTKEPVRDDTFSRAHKAFVEKKKARKEKSAK